MPERDVELKHRACLKAVSPPFSFMYSFSYLRKDHNDLTTRFGMVHTLDLELVNSSDYVTGLHSALVLHKTVKTHITCWLTSGRLACRLVFYIFYTILKHNTDTSDNARPTAYIEQNPFCKADGH
jgi:hypothetical protein